ncbi:nitroreductase [Rhodocollybia butyracea]|uniref:Nitroreductase n=1 Tax=Rhodocollybia butyracea TaxID=206335 RepID=A0A9P5QBJ5_9AGAR|nr:nitroreductase [Rhodocollybia butyracea]
MHSTMSTSPTSLLHRTMTCDETIVTRHSTRQFLDKPVPKDILQRALNLAAHAPSNSNIQPWRLYILSGPTADRLKKALVAEASAGAVPRIPPLPDAFKHFRSELGKKIYGEGLGIPRDDFESRRAAVLRNFDFFGAPMAVIVCMDNTLSQADAMSVGMYLQTFLLALTANRVGSCVEVSVAGYPEIIRQTVGIPVDMDIICGVAIGYEDESMKVNQLRTKRISVEETAIIIES